jgi:hypothetical protein
MNPTSISTIKAEPFTPSPSDSDYSRPGSEASLPPLPPSEIRPGRPRGVEKPRRFRAGRLIITQCARYLRLRPFDDAEVTGLEQLLFEEACRLEQTAALTGRVRGFVKEQRVLEPAEFRIARIVGAQRARAREHIFRRVAASIVCRRFCKKKAGHGKQVGSKQNDQR